MVSNRVFGEGFFVASLLLNSLGVSSRSLTWALWKQLEPTTSFIIVLVFNYVACIPVLLCVGLFSMYHFYSMAYNTTTIEGWEKDKVATMMRRGHIEEVCFYFP
jgi:hypothetical protein